MTALAQERLPEFAGQYPARKTLPMKANVTIYKGAMVGIDSSGNAMPAGLLAGGTVRVVGVASHTMTNGAVAGANKIEVTSGIFKMLNHGADLVTNASICADCYVVDDQTVALTNGTSTRAPAGKVQMVESDGVRVYIGAQS